MKEKVKSLLKNEIKMTMGCTDPGSVAYAASKAASMLEGELKSIEVILSPNIYKNAVYVGIPVIKMHGIEYAALLGALIKKPEKKLEVLAEIDDSIIEKFNMNLNRLPVSVQWEETGDPVYISVTCRNESSAVTVILKGDYDCISSINKDGEQVYNIEPVEKAENAAAQVWNYRELFRGALLMNEHDGAFLFKHEEINKRAALSALQDENLELLNKIAEKQDFNISDIANLARLYVFNASKLRMSGEKVPIVSVAGSGNLGIATFLTVSAVCDCLHAESDRKAKAMYLAVLTAIYMKSQMNRVTVICGTSIAAAAGAAAATAYLLGGDYEETECAINTVIGSIGGVLCDGAKESCAFKAGFAAECAVLSGFMAANKSGIKSGSGIITCDIDKNIQSVGRINNVGMKDTDSIILSMILQQKEGELV